MKLAGTQFDFLPFAVPTIKRALTWRQGGDLVPRVTMDRGVSFDAYTALLRVQLGTASMNVIQTLLNTYGTAPFALSSFEAYGQEIFGPAIDYSGGLTAVWVPGYSPRTEVFPGIVSALEVNLRLVGAAPLIATSASLANLRLHSGGEADTLPTLKTAVGYDAQPGILDTGDPDGEFIAECHQSNSTAPAIAKFLTTNRGSSFAFPSSIAASPYPFGYHRGMGPFNVVLRDWSMKRLNLQTWVFKLHLCEYIDRFITTTG